MLFGFLGAFIMGLISTSFSRSIPCKLSIDPSDDLSGAPLKDSGYVLDSQTASAKGDTNDVPPSHCNRTSRLMNITFSEEFENMKEEFSSKWNDYVTVPRGEQWSRRNLSYSIHSYGGYDKDDVTDAIKRSFQKWADAAPTLKFTAMRDGASSDIRIHFVESLKSEGAQAMTQLPTGGRVRFSGHVSWTIPRKKDSANYHAYYGGFGGWGGYGGFGGFGGWGGFRGSGGVGFICVATHELGHAVGIRHSDTSRAIMNAHYPCEGTRDINLYDDDIKAVQYLYPGGSPTVRTGESSPANPKSRVNSGPGGRGGLGGRGGRGGYGGHGGRGGYGGPGGNSNRGNTNESSSDSSDSTDFSDTTSESSSFSSSSSSSNFSSSSSSSSSSSFSDSSESSSSSESSGSD